MSDAAELERQDCSVGLLGIAVHFAAYMLFAPFIGGFALSLCKYVVEKDFGFGVTLLSSIMCGLAAIPFFGTWGAVVALVTSPSLLCLSWNRVANLTGAIAFVWLVCQQQQQFVRGYELVVYVVAVGFALVLTSVTRGLVGLPVRQERIGE